MVENVGSCGRGWKKEECWSYLLKEVSRKEGKLERESRRPEYYKVQVLEGERVARERIVEEGA